VIIP